jgi:HNH endonuclease
MTIKMREETVMKELVLHQVYKTASTVENGIEIGVPLNFESKKRILEIQKNAALNFNRHTLLHHYIKYCFLMDNEELFCENPYNIIEGAFELEFLHSQFVNYGIDIEILEIKFDENDYPITTPSRVYNWYIKNKKKFELLSEKICDDIFYILFSNRILLQQFNIIVSRNFQKFNFPKNKLSSSGKIKRLNIPKWVRKAVYYRDKGRCVICTTDLSGVINTLELKNFDHIVPLDLFGVNDPTNIQLLCKKCNLEKLNKNTDSSSIYEYWFD